VGLDNYPITCLHALEHLEKSDTNLLHLGNGLKLGSYLIIKVAFEFGDQAHLPTTAMDFVTTNSESGF
jgi:hypothetical protein